MMAPIASARRQNYRLVQLFLRAGNQFLPCGPRPRRVGDALLELSNAIRIEQQPGVRRQARGGQTPGTQHQAPEKNQRRQILQPARTASPLPPWSLVFGHFLVFGV
jgi:hypothetical protein